MAELRLNAHVGSEHPERKDDEVFIGYVNHNGFEEIGWSTKRKGEQVIDDSGTDVTDEAKIQGIFPVFAQDSEVKHLWIVHL